MKVDSNFVRLNSPAHEASSEVQFYWEEHPVTARQGDTIAAALLATGIIHTRDTAVSASSRGPFCMMGSCFECRVEVNGELNVQACMRVIEPGISVKRQRS
jgi:predicted molibdopterin-dependent oxidoreductase YjgC